LLEEKKSLECHVVTLNEENKKLKSSIATVKDEKMKLKYYVEDLLKLAHQHRDKIKKIAELCEE
jgi:bifunctional N-acetylglucosamine-1-phosphate-uridyltransferase/glucosamine-1-phosphate-acetyltransferase GlmU-like protein